MRGKRISSSDWHPRACAGKEISKGFQPRGNLDNIVLIDVDCDNCDNVIIVDAPESMPQKLHGLNVRKRVGKIRFQDVINIDDDEEDADRPGPSAAVAGGDELDSDSISSRRYRPTPDCPRSSVDSDADDFCVVPNGHSTSESSDCNNHQNNECLIGRRFGLSPDLGKDASNNDFSDSELIEDSSGELRQHWEEAFLKRKHDYFDGQVGLGDGARGSTSRYEGGVNGRDGFLPDEPVFCHSSNAHMRENASACGDSYVGTSMNFSFVNQQHGGADPAQCSEEKSWSTESFNSADTSTDVNGDGQINSARNAKSPTYENPGSDGAFFLNKEQGTQECFSSFDQGKGFEESDHMTSCFLNEDNRKMFDSCSDDLDKRTTFTRRVPSCFSSHPNVVDVPIVSEKVDAPSNKNVLQNEKKIFYDQCHNEVLHERKSTDVQELPKKPLDQNSCDSSDGSVDKVGNAVEELISNRKSDRQAMANANRNLEQGIERCCTRKQEESLAKTAFIAQISGERSTLDSQDAAYAHVDDGDIINGREKLKETDEYRRVIEEEWQSRQRQLQLQAEEAQRLRKKRRAEAMRKLDMERRQKQRLDEIRETQKKDVESMNLREQLRAEIRRGLSKLESTCVDMASLLRGLGIHVPGSPPISQEVHAAYKRALLKFHPDRASRNDLRQQVEAEEKFKLISRMKEKFLPT